MCVGVTCHSTPTCVGFCHFVKHIKRLSVHFWLPVTLVVIRIAKILVGTLDEIWNVACILLYIMDLDHFSSLDETQTPTDRFMKVLCASISRKDRFQVCDGGTQSPSGSYVVGYFKR